MATESVPGALDVGVVQCSDTRSNRLSDYWMLTKPEINLLIAITTAIAFCTASPGELSRFPWALLLHTLLWTFLVASGAGTLNQLIELRFDAQMRRTARRPLVSGRIESRHALWFGFFLSLAVLCTWLWQQIP